MHSGPITPTRCSEWEAAELQALRERHCVQGHKSGECAGRTVIDRSGFVLTCRLCGTARHLFPIEAANGRQQ